MNDFIKYFYSNHFDCVARLKLKYNRRLCLLQTDIRNSEKCKIEQKEQIMKIILNDFKGMISSVNNIVGINDIQELFNTVIINEIMSK
jgi:hypothetical protein